MNFGFYVPGHSFLHRVHPGAKLGIGVMLCLWALALGGALPWVLVASLLLLGAAFSVGRRYIRSLALFGTPLVVAAILIVLVAPPGEGAEILMEWTAFSLTRDKLARIVNLAGRLVVLVGVFQLFAVTTDPEKLFAALIDVGVPRALALGLVGGIQFIPNLQWRIRQVLDAQAARGLPTHGGPIQRARALTPLVRPVILSVLNEAADRELALILRGFGLPGETTSVEEAPFEARDRYLVSVGVGGSIAALAVLVL